MAMYTQTGDSIAKHFPLCFSENSVNLTFCISSIMLKLLSFNMFIKQNSFVSSNRTTVDPHLAMLSELSPSAALFPYSPLLMIEGGQADVHNWLCFS